MDQKDHDILIKLDTKMAIMCTNMTKFQNESTEKQTKFQDENREEHKEIFKLFEKYDNKLGSKVSFTLYKWLTGIMIVGIISIGVATTDLRITFNKSINEIKTTISQYHKIP